MLHYNLKGTWKTVRYAYAKVDGNWYDIGQVFCKVNGAWYPIWSYSWTTGSWGSCSVTCGGGTQTRSVTCTRNDGYTVDDKFCTKYVGSKPATSQSCNTQACEEKCSLSYTQEDYENENCSFGCGGTTATITCGVYSPNISRYYIDGSWRQYYRGGGFYWNGTNMATNGTMYNMYNGYCYPFTTTPGDASCYVTNSGYKYYGKEDPTVSCLYSEWNCRETGDAGNIDCSSSCTGYLANIYRAPV